MTLGRRRVLIYREEIPTVMVLIGDINVNLRRLPQIAEGENGEEEEEEDELTTTLNSSTSGSSRS